MMKLELILLYPTESNWLLSPMAAYGGPTVKPTQVFGTARAPQSGPQSLLHFQASKSQVQTLIIVLLFICVFLYNNIIVGDMIIIYACGRLI